jgi:hypothetical protein
LRVELYVKTVYFSTHPRSDDKKRPDFQAIHLH